MGGAKKSVIRIPAYFPRNFNYHSLVWITVFALKLFRIANGTVGIQPWVHPILLKLPRHQQLSKANSLKVKIRKYNICNTLMFKDRFHATNNHILIFFLLTFPARKELM